MTAPADQHSTENDSPKVQGLGQPSTLDDTPVTTSPQNGSDAVSAGQDDHTSSDELPDDETDPVAALRRESAKYRTRLRDAETERDTLKAQITTMQRQAAVAAAQGPGALTDGADLFRDDQVNLDDLLAENGAVDRHKLAEAVTGVVQRQPHWSYRNEPPARKPTEALKAGTSDPTAPSEAVGWDQVLRKATQQ